MKNIYINAGYYNTKIATESQLKIFESKVQFNEDAKRYIKIDDRKLEIGNGKRNINDKNNNMVNDYITIYSILNLCDRIDSTNIILALPINQYLNTELKNDYKNKLMNRTLNYEIDGIKKIITVEKVEVFMEGAAAMLNYNYKGIVGLIDIGGNTANCILFNNGKAILESITQLDCSMLRLEKEIIDTVNIKKLSNYQDYEFDSLISSKNIEIKLIIDNLINKFIDNLKYNLKLKKWNVDNLKLFFTGGGSLTLSAYIKDAFGNVEISEDPLFDNVKGLQKVGRVIFR
ncbi:hypothetical protein J2Z76_000423 [Sedimentibacter acidaminivorans]|uniref:Actin-like protein N-terminal domain-containing protein n=1 Tax=Sedimentibacter acidaminivorans TaxID=913099 RepID=A0ABS4GAZ5_9FIRM|nr:ParM/StbA family protein [Sedimentibacter acidaminivorans]MBP1924570.1 hypothetical protein [Sedimentibacter acidaminivorans]